MIAGKRYNPCKPLASKGRSKLGPICFVDSSTATSGPRLYESSKIVIITTTLPTEKPVVKEEQAIEAAKQWASAQYTGDGTSTTRPWIKSWYFPLDAFNPWPEKTDLCCWWCSCPFDWPPFPMPYSYDRLSNRYRSIGLFCGPSCAKAYCRGTEKYSSHHNIDYFIDRIATEFYDYKLNVQTGASKKCTIPPAPPKEILQKFCGPKGFTIEQYRALCCCGRTLKVHPPHIITMKQVVEAEQQTAKKRKIHHVENPDDIQCTTDLVKKKRIPYAGPGAKRMTDYLKPRS